MSIKSMLMALFMFALISSNSQAQSTGSHGASISLSQLIQVGHYDVWVRDFASFAEEAVHQALIRGYYLPIRQREALLRDVRTKLSPEVMSQRLVTQMHRHANNRAVLHLRSWYGSEVGDRTLRGIQHAYRPGAERRQATIAPALEADEDRYAWWQAYSRLYPFAEQWLASRDEVLLRSVSFIAKTQKPFTPFDNAKFEEQLALNTFNLRPEVERRIMWRWLDSLGQLEVTEYVRYKALTTSNQHIAFLRLVGKASDAVMRGAIKDFETMLDQVIVPDSAPISNTTADPVEND